MKTTGILLLVFICSSSIGFSQQMNTSSYRDSTIPYIELNTNAYDFSYPVLSNVLDSSNFQPPADGVYLKSGFGHRYFSTTVTKSDNHGGYDYWPYHEYNGVTYDDSNKIAITCMCDGYVSQVLNGPDSLLELTGTGRSVRVTCDSSFQSFGYKIKINYRHLNSLGILAEIADTAAFGTVSISKGDTIGIIGESGTTTNVHLHLSTQTIHPIYGSAFVNATRLFNPDESPGVLRKLDQAKIELLHDWPDSALFRVIWPFNETINQFDFINDGDTITFNKEDAYNTGASLRDKHDCLPRISVFPYQFNGSQTALERYLTEMNSMPPLFPASPNRDTNLVLFGYNHIPISEDSPSFVYDFVIKELDSTHQTCDFQVRVSDVWGYTLDADFQSTGIDSILSCNNYTWIDGITYTTSNSTASHILTNASGCDSMVMLHLIIDSLNTDVLQNGYELISQESGGNYQWINCSDSTPILGATNQTFTATSNGDYALVISDGSCSDTSACFTISTIGIIENEFGNQFKIYPNPTEGHLEIDLGATQQDIHLTLTDMKGRVIEHKKIANCRMFSFDIEQPVNTYLLTIEANNKKATIRIIKR